MTYQKYEGVAPSEDAADLQNDARTCQPIGTELTQPRSPSVLGYTYFVRDADMIKIGSSTRPASRIKELQSGVARELEVLAVVPMEIADELETHQRFAHLRERGEWFRAELDLLEFIRRLESDAIEPALAKFETIALQPKRPAPDPVVMQLKELGRELSSRWSKLPKQARPFASNIIAQVKWIETPEDVERMRPHIAYQTRRLASVSLGNQ